MDHPHAAAQQFAPPGRVLDIREYGRGNVNDTFLVTVGETGRGAHPTLRSATTPPENDGRLNFLPKTENRKPKTFFTQPPETAANPRFILQRLNLHVFPRPELIMGNLKVVSAHIRRRLAQAPLGPGRRFETPQVRLTRDGRDHFRTPDGSFWRALSFIEAAETFDIIKDEAHAREVGYALGRFHNLLSDLPPDHLSDTLPGFHITPGYLRRYDEVLARRGAPPSPEVRYSLQFVAGRSALAPVLEEAKAQGRLGQRIIHGDPKVNNVMLDSRTGQAVGLVDLDTVKPGLVHYDIGDCLRSGGNPLGEETEDWEAVRFEPDLCRALLSGYLASARDFLTDHDYAYLYDAIRLIAFELGLRFFTDYLAGNVYFKARRPEHNLARALVQFRLTESIESQAAAIGAIIKDMSPALRSRQGGENDLL